MIMKSILMIVSFLWFGLPILADNPSLVMDIEQHINVLEKRVKELETRADEISTNAEGIVSNRVETMVREYDSKMKKRLGEIDVEIGDAVRDREFYSKRYAELKSEYTSAYANLRDDYDKFVGRLGHWLTVIGIIVALISIGVPAVATFVQWKNIKAGISDLKQEKDKELSKLRQDCVRALHMSLSQGVLNVDTGVPLSTLDKANVIYSIVICFDDLLECAMRTKDGNMVKDEVAAFRPFLSRWSDSDIPERIYIWKESEKLLKAAMKSRMNLSRRGDFVELLRGDSDTFKWLETFYSKFADWKFA